MDLFKEFEQRGIFPDKPEVSIRISGTIILWLEQLVINVPLVIEIYL